MIIITTICVIGLAVLFMGAWMNDDTRWRQCTRCGKYFNRWGETREPFLTLNIQGPGVCPECGRDLDYGKQ